MSASATHGGHKNYAAAHSACSRSFSFVFSSIYYIRQEGHVFVVVCLFVCLPVY